MADVSQTVIFQQGSGDKWSGACSCFPLQTIYSQNYASERSKFSFPGVADSRGGSWASSVSDGWDSCFAAACRTRLWTSVDEGDVGNPILFGSTLPAAHENAWAPRLTGVSKSLWNMNTRVKTPRHQSASHQHQWNLSYNSPQIFWQINKHISYIKPQQLSPTKYCNHMNGSFLIDLWNF